VWRVVFRSHQRHLMRLVLVCLAIAVGVAFLAGTFILTDTDNQAIGSTSAQAYVNVSVAVQGHRSSSNLPGLAGFIPVPEQVLTTVRAVPGVARAVGEVDGYAQLVAPDGTLIGGHTSSAQGISVGPVASLRPFVLDSGRYPSAADQVVVDAHTFTAQGYHLGQQVRVVTAQPTRTFTLVGTISSRRSSDVLGSTLVGFTVPAAQQLLGTPAAYSVLLTSAVPGLTQAALAARLEAAVGPSYFVVTGRAFAAGIAAISSVGAPKFSTVLDVVLGIALFVGALVIFNIISMLVAQRRQELALLRCMGATRSQLYRSVLLEGAALGFLASIVGLGLGLVSADVLRAVLDSPGAQTSAAPLVVGWHTIVISLVVGTVVTCVASLLPAVAASKISPVSALRQDAMSEVAEATTPWRATGLALAVFGLALVGVGLFIDQGNEIELYIVGAGMILGIIGLGRLSPLLVPPLITVLGWPLQHLSGLPGHLGRLNTMRNARRTTATAAALIIGVALVSVLAIIETSAQASTNSAIDHSLSADFEVLSSGSGPLNLGPSQSQALPPTVLTRLRAQPQLVVSPYSFVNFQLRGQHNFGAAVDPATIARMISFGHVQGSIAALQHGGIAASSVQAGVQHLHVGEVVPVAFSTQVESAAGGAATVAGAATVSGTPTRVVAIYERGDNEAGYLFSTAAAKAIDPSLSLSAVLVAARPGVSQQQAAAAVSRAVAGFSNVSVQDESQVRAAQDQSISGQLNLISVLLVLAIVVALLGIVNTLALSVVERTRELALLRAVGMSRSQIRSMVRLEAALIGMIGALLGVVLGLFLGWVFQRALRTQGVGELVVPWARLVVYVFVGAATGLIAGTIPARRAARVNMLDAIAAE
jgi:putative ABC transport system permease protein